VVKGGNWKTTDSDGDGHLNWLDIDADNDGIVDNVEAQSTSGYIAPSGTINIDGVDLAYDPAQGGIKIILLDTDLTLADPDGIPDFLDPDSDNDWVPDYIEGHDQDADGKPDRILSGKDSDSDGLDEAYDIVVNGCNNGNSTGSNSPLQDFDGDGMNDWRDENDDDDEYLTRFEDLNADGDYSNDVTGHVGHPEYLWYGRDCELFIPDAFSPNYDNIHDYFQIYCIESYPNAQMYIFDQVGNKLYEKEHYGNMNVHKTADEAWWDGTTSNRSATRNGNKVVPGTYYYVLRLGNGEVKKSFVFVSY
jgi:gliding motility-associated-like protein